MGIDIKYQAMPEGCSILEDARNGRMWVGYLEFYDLYAPKGPGRIRLDRLQAEGKKVEDTLVTFAHAAELMEQNYPGLSKRVLRWGRRWDMVHYLLSATRRGEKPVRDDILFAEAIFGREIIIDSQYQTLKYLSPDKVVKVSNLFCQVTRGQMRQHYNPEKMQQVYKFVQLPQDERGFQEIYVAFEKIRDFYEMVNKCEEGVIVNKG